MQIRAEQLESGLQKQLPPVIFISGEETLLVNEAADSVRRHARKQGYSDRQVFDVEPGFDWNSLGSEASSLSLFSERRLFELRMPSGKPGEQGARALKAYAGRPPDDAILLVIAGKLEPAARKSKWVQVLDQAGMVIFIWPVDREHLPVWISRRMKARGLQPTPEAATLLAERVEGNLLACAQEIDKLQLLQGEGPVDIEDIGAMVTDSARFDVFRLVDCALDGDAVRGLRILQGLRGEGVEPVLVLWALARELRSLAGMAAAIAGGEPVSRVMTQYRIWDSRKKVVGKALARYGVGEWRSMQRCCARLDLVIKGQAAGNAWDELVQLTMRIAGHAVLPAAVS